jgi:CAAX protease family protein
MSTVGPYRAVLLRAGEWDADSPSLHGLPEVTATVRRLVAFFVLAFALAWVCWGAAAAVPATRSSGSSWLSIMRGPLFLVGTFAPGIVALALEAYSRGRDGAGALFRRIGRWRVPARWYLFAIVYMAVIKLLAALVYRLLIGAWPRFGETRPVLMFLALIVSTWAQAGEELGWRGYALPRLALRIGLPGASVLLGAIWAVWHLPLFYIEAGDTYGQSFPLFFLEVTALSVTMAWLYWRTGGSLLLVMLLHSAVNNTKDIVPSVVPGATNPFALSTSRAAWITVALMWVTAAYLLTRMWGADDQARSCLYSTEQI